MTNDKYITGSFHTKADGFQGICNVAGTNRRLGILSITPDIWVVPPDTLGAFILGYTGNTEYVRTMRLLATRTGYHLSNHGLFKVINSGEKVKVAGENEKGIYDVLGLTWVPPEQRNA
jgi:DNA polymerase/3'-5' exonuclease PolX